MKNNTLYSSLFPDQDLAKYFTENKGLVIDLGCGYGADALSLAEKGYQVIALDQENNLRVKHKNITFQKGKLTDYVQNNFSGVIASNSLQFLEPQDRLDCLAYYLKNLNKKGVFYIKIFQKFVSPAFLSVFPEEPSVEYFVKEDNHPPYGKHLHEMAKIIYLKK